TSPFRRQLQQFSRLGSTRGWALIKASARVVDDFEHFVAQLFRPKLAGECVLVAKLLVACDPAENGGPAGHPGFATDGAKAFALGKPVADRHGDVGAIIGWTAALGLVIIHSGYHDH